MSGIKKGVALRKIVKVLYEASKGKRFSRPMLGRFGMIDCESSVRYKSEKSSFSTKFVSFQVFSPFLFLIQKKTN